MNNLSEILLKEQQPSELKSDFYDYLKKQPTEWTPYLRYYPFYGGPGNTIEEHATRILLDHLQTPVQPEELIRILYLYTDLTTNSSCPLLGLLRRQLFDMVMPLDIASDTITNDLAVAKIYLQSQIKDSQLIVYIDDNLYEQYTGKQAKTSDAQIQYLKENPQYLSIFLNVVVQACKQKDYLKINLMLDHYLAGTDHQFASFFKAMLQSEKLYEGMEIKEGMLETSFDFALSPPMRNLCALTTKIAMRTDPAYLTTPQIQLLYTASQYKHVTDLYKAASGTKQEEYAKLQNTYKTQLDQNFPEFVKRLELNESLGLRYSLTTLCDDYLTKAQHKTPDIYPEFT